MSAAAGLVRVGSRPAARGLIFCALFVATMAAAVPFELPDGASPWYPAAGVLLAWALVDGWVIAPVAVVLRVAVMVIAHGGDAAHRLGPEIVRSVAIVIVYVVAASVLRTLARGRSGMRVLTVFLGSAVLAAPFVAAVLSALVDGAADVGAPLWSTTTESFFIGDAIGVITMVPLLAAWQRLWRPQHAPTNRADALEIAVQMTALIAIPALSAIADVDGLFFLVLFVGLLPLVWLAVRSDMVVVTLGLLASTTTVAVAARIAIERGPYEPIALVTVQSLMLTAAIITWFVCAGRVDDVARARHLAVARGEVERAATHDPTIDALNRAGLALALAESPPHQRVVVVDIGVPRETLHLLGSQFGDEVAAVAVDRLRTAVGADAPIARLEPGVLAAVVTSVSDRIDIDAPRLLAPLGVPVTVAGVDLHPTPRLGLADAGSSGDAAIEHALFAVHIARRRNAAALLFDQGMGDLAAAERSRLSDLQRGLREGEIVAWFQPIVSTTDRRIVGVEALARWVHPRLGVVDAADFVPTAESSGLIGAVGRRVRASTMSCAAAVLPLIADQSFRFSINVSALEFGHDLVSELLASAADAGIDASRIMVEVTETTAIADMHGAREVLTRLREAGMSIAIDDFGTGQSSMAQLHSLPLDELKIDARFVRGLPALRDLAIVRTIQGLADEFHLDVVAEGVENEEQLAALAQCQVRRVQGYLTGRAMPAVDLEALLRGPDARPAALSGGR